MKGMLIAVAVALLAGCCIAFTGCTGCSVAGGVVDVSVAEVDGCEYIYFSTSTGSGGITHKANCPNPEHRRTP